VRLVPVKTPIVKPGDDLVRVTLKALRQHHLKLEDNDVLAVASKIVSCSQGRVVRLSEVKPSARAKRLARKCSLEPEFAELLLQEAENVYGCVEKAVLTLRHNILTANAGIDNKNAPLGSVVLWPENLEDWLKDFTDRIKRKTCRRVGVVIVDSGLIPLRVGTIGLALAVAGFNPLREWRGKKDLYGRSISITRHAIADDLASAAHLLMGEAVERTPVVLVKDVPVEFDNKVHDSAEMMMPFRECIFMSRLKS
jgi:coenzyme F420-0:L-glutamate ligase/coenzyme F420-1:gamma-L-glutamate ligase